MKQQGYHTYHARWHIVFLSQYILFPFFYFPYPRIALATPDWNGFEVYVYAVTK